MTSVDPTPASEMDDLLARISVDPAVCSGKPCVRGTRIWVGLVLGALAHGASVAELLAEYPQLEEIDVRACLAFGAAMANGRLIDLPGAADPAACARGDVASEGVRVKLDENLGALAVTMFSDAGHDVATIPGQNLGDRPDQAIYDACCAEKRLLVTLDLDSPTRSASTLGRQLASP